MSHRQRGNEQLENNGTERERARERVQIRL